MENVINMIHIYILIIVGIISAVLLYLFATRHNSRSQKLDVTGGEDSKLSEAKNNFLSKLINEINTQLNSIMNIAEMIRNNDDNIDEHMMKIKDAERALQTLATVLEIESDNMDYQEDRYQMSVLIQEMNAYGSENAHKHGLDFCIETDERHPSALAGDISRIKLIISCFLDNAVKYTDSGQITLRFSFIETKDKDEVVLCISVTDTGIGIKDEFLSKLFENFANNYSTLDDDIGYGLFIAQKLIDRMKGRIFVESEYGKGSRFSVEIPQAVANRKPMGDWRLADGVAVHAQSRHCGLDPQSYGNVCNKGIPDHIM